MARKNEKKLNILAYFSSILYNIIYIILYHYLYNIDKIAIFSKHLSSGLEATMDILYGVS